MNLFFEASIPLLPKHEKDGKRTRRNKLENIGGRLLAIGPGDEFLDLTPNQGSKSKINKWEYIKLKNSHTAKGVSHQQNENATY